MYRMRMPNGRLVETGEVLMICTENGEYHTCTRDKADSMVIRTEGNGCYLIQCSSHTNRVLLTDINRQLWQNGCAKFSHHNFYVTRLRRRSMTHWQRKQAMCKRNPKDEL